MTDTQAILGRVTALRERLAEFGEHGAKTGADKPATLTQKVKAGSEYDGLIDCVLRQLPSDTPLVRLPGQLTARAHRLLQSGKDLLQQLRILGDDLPTDLGPTHPTIQTYDKTVAMADVALRMIGAFPDSPSVQLRLCDGVEATLAVIQERIGRIAVISHRHHKETGWVDAVAVALAALEAGSAVDLNALTDVVRAILAEQRDGETLRFLSAPATDAARTFAAHGINVACAMARLIRNDSILARRPTEPLLAALVHDVGMIQVPAEVWNKAGRLDDSERQRIESHAAIGAEWLRRAMPDKTWLAEAVGDHHECLDGTGYPAGRRDNQIGWLPRLLAVCDVYVAMRSSRPYREELNSRTALTDTLMMAEAGALDRHAAERLLSLSMYPAGTAVELADGAFGVVAAVPQSRTDLKAASRPVVALLTDTQGQALPHHQILDLGVCDGRSIIRALTSAERQTMLAGYDAEFA